MAPNAEGKLEATEAAAAPAAPAAAEEATTTTTTDNNSSIPGRLIWRLNDFPYYYEAGIEHHLLWCTDPLSVDEVGRIARERFAPGGPGNASSKKKRQHLVFVNPVALQSVLAVWHAHVLVRDAPSDE
jgi:hypothetical protein